MAQCTRLRCFFAQRDGSEYCCVKCEQDKGHGKKFRHVPVMPGLSRHDNVLSPEEHRELCAALDTLADARLGEAFVDLVVLITT